MPVYARECPGYQAPVVDPQFSHCFCGMCTPTDTIKGSRSVHAKSSTKLSCKKKRKSKCLGTEADWCRHCDVLQGLSTPRCHMECLLCPPDRGRKVPIKKLCHRIKSLSRPKYPGRKRNYVEDPDDCRQQSGKIKNWKEHCKWLNSRAQPKEYIDPCCYEFPEERSPKLHKLKRTLNLCQPKYRVCKDMESESDISFSKPFSGVSEAALHYNPTERIKELSEPKPFIIGRKEMEHVPIECLCMVNPRALKYEATDRIKELARPKHFCKWYLPPHLYHYDGPPQKPICLCKRCHHINKLATPKLCWIQPRDYRHIKFLDVYKMGRKCQTQQHSSGDTCRPISTTTI